MLRSDVGTVTPSAVPLLIPRRGSDRLAEDVEEFLAGIQAGPVAAVFNGPGACLRQQLLESPA